MAQAFANWYARRIRRYMRASEKAREALKRQTLNVSKALKMKFPPEETGLEFPEDYEEMVDPHAD